MTKQIKDRFQNVSPPQPITTKSKSFNILDIFKIFQSKPKQPLPKKEQQTLVLTENIELKNPRIYDHWNPEIHKFFQKQMKEQIKTILLISIRNPNTNEPNHQHSNWWKLPKDILFEIFQLLIFYDK